MDYNPHRDPQNTVTTRKIIKEVLADKVVLTAEQVVDEANRYYGATYRQHLPSVSSKLKKMVDEHVLLRVKGYGPRGGYGYLLNPNYREF